MRKMTSAVALLALISISPGCSHYHLRASGNRANSSYFRKTISGGKRADYVVPPTDSGAQVGAGLPSSADCKANGLYEVGVSSSWKDAAGTVFSFGRWSRVKVEWLCAKEPPVIGPRGASPQPPATNAKPPKQTGTGNNGFRRRTVHALFWGAVQQNLTPPADADPNTPANCKSLRQVKIPPNYGYALITVFTAGIWSPSRIAWRCNEDVDVASKSTASGPPLPGAAQPLFSGIAPLPPATNAEPSKPSQKE